MAVFIIKAPSRSLLLAGPLRQLAVLLLLLPACLAQANNGSVTRSQLCPVPEDILPCTCKADEVIRIYLFCSDVTSNDQLAQVFTAQFPFPDLYRLSIGNNQHLKVIREGDLGTQVTFQIINIRRGVLQLVEEGAFANSYNTLHEIALTENELTSFPFQEINFFTNLFELSLSYNSFVGFPNISSKSLGILKLGSNPLGEIKAGDLQNLPNLQEIYLVYSELTDLEPGTFTNLTRLWYVNVAGNNLTTLSAGTVELHDVFYGAFIANNNCISEVEVNAITGDTYKVDIQSNELQELPQEVWGPLFVKSFNLDPSNNPLSCGCDVAWIVTNPDNLARMDQNTTCIDGVNIHDLDPDIYLNLC